MINTLDVARQDNGALPVKWDWCCHSCRERRWAKSFNEPINKNNKNKNKLATNANTYHSLERLGAALKQSVDVYGSLPEFPNFHLTAFFAVCGDNKSIRVLTDNELEFAHSPFVDT